MMHREVTAIVLCILAHAASAQCTAAPIEASASPAAVAQATHTAPAAQPKAQPKAHAELIQTAAAGTRDDGPPVVHESGRPHAGTQDHPRRGGAAMLLAALALMSGIALRRYGTNNT